MIYLVQSYYTDKQNHPRKCLKIGYAKNIEERMKAYKTHNPSIQLLKTRDGERDLESFLHRCFDKYKLPDFNEWFIYKKEIIDKFDILDPNDETITREEYLEYIRKEIITNIIPEIYRNLRSQIPDLLVELKQEFDNNCNDIYFSLYTEFPENECKKIIIRSFKFLRELEIDYFTDYSFSDIISEFPEKIFRQRLKENVFRDDCLFIYKLSDSAEVIEKEFEQVSQEKLQGSYYDMDNFNVLKKLCKTEKDKLRLVSPLKDIRNRINSYHYSKDYTGINERTGEVVINKLVMLAERRAFELRNNVYKNDNDILVYNEFEDISSDKISSGLSQELRLEFIKKFKVGIRYTLRDIKFLISSVYNSLGILKTPKATDILDVFEVKSIVIIDKVTKKRIAGYEILSLK